MNKKRIIIIFVIIICAIAFAIIYPVSYNTTSVKEGYIYYCTSDGSYFYNLKTKTKKKNELTDYDYEGSEYHSLREYLPFKDGYIASVEYDIEGTMHYAIICNGNKVFDSQYVINSLTIKNNYLFFTECKEECSLIALHLDSLNSFVISNKADYGFSFENNYLYCNEREPYEPEAESNIVVFDCESNEFNTQVIDKGIVLRNTVNQLVYTKYGLCYRYDFALKQPVKFEGELIEDEFENRYLGNVQIDEVVYQFHLKQLKITEYDTIFNRTEENGRHYEEEAMQEKPPKVICSRGYVKMTGVEKVLSFPVISLSSNSSYIRITAIETKGNTYYPNIACTFSIY